MLSAQELASVKRVSPFRNQRLFSEFLPTGYRLTTLDSVADKDKIIGLKVVLGTLITLYDDYADRPDRLNPRLLQLLYRVPFEKIEVNDAFLNPEEKFSLDLAKSLFAKLLSGLAQLKNYRQLFPIFRFDLKQFFLANHFCELLTECPHLSNSLENRLYLHHNMGIVMAGMIDLMSLAEFEISELGQARRLFLLGQRAGRISNVVATYEREREENDLTNELAADGNGGASARNFRMLAQELRSLFQEMNRHENIKGFSAVRYREGMQSLHSLHMNLEGVI